MRFEKHTLFTIGKGPVSRFNNQARVWVIDMTTKQQATLDLPKKLVRAGVLDDIILFTTYSDVHVTVKSDNRLLASDKKFPNPEPSFFVSEEVFERIRVPVVKMSELNNIEKYSATNHRGYYLAYDIRCIKRCTITKSFESPQKIDGWKYQLGSIAITDYTTDGYTTDKGLDIPSKLFCWIHPEFAYPVTSTGDAYGVLKIKNYDVVFDLCFFDVKYMGEEEFKDPVPYKSKKQKFTKPPKEKKVKKKSTRNIRTIKTTKNLKKLIKAKN